MILTGYKVDDVIYENHLSLILHAHRTGDSLPVIIKILNVPLPTPKELSVFRYEYQITEALQSLHCILHPLAFEKYKNSLMMVLEDIHGKSLLEHIELQKFKINEFLPLAIKITKALGEIHDSGFVHKDIKPSNIIWNREDDSLKLIGLSTAVKLSHEHLDLKTSSEIAGTIAFMAPEQTGRINRSVDRRSDFYSLGITFYMMLTQELPFKANDTLTLIYQQITQLPQRVDKMDPTIPKPVADIIAKLLAKMPENRYQTIQSIIADLECCSESLLQEGRIKDFKIGQHDEYARFVIPEKLYGRQNDIKKLVDCFERVKENKFEILTVMGSSGIGKSSYVHELFKEIIAARGYFLEGKFDQFQRNIPCLALTRMLQDFIKTIQTESESSLQIWREKIQKAVGDNGQILIDLVPEFEQVLGKQPPLTSLDPILAENRFLYTLTEVFQSLAQKDHPLVIFWDDLQWADNISLKLLESLFSHINTSNLLFIFSYRDTDPKIIYPFKIIMQRVQDFVTVTSIKLNNLSLNDVTEMIADTFHAEKKDVADLAGICFKKTLGNPFFFKQIVAEIHDKGLITFNRKKNQWTVDLCKVEQQPIANNVLDLMVSRLKKLNKNSQHIISVASCIGRSFSLKLLSTMLEAPENEIAKELFYSLEEDFIIPTNSDFRYATETLHSGARFRFAHDKIREAAYLMVKDEDKAKIHLKIGKLLLKRKKYREKNIIAIVDHLNKGIALISDQEEINELMSLNYQAGLKAKDTQAFKISLIYFKTAIKLSHDEDWINRYDLMQSLYNEAALSASILSNEKLLNSYSEVILKNSKTVLDTVNIYRVLIFWDLSKGRPEESIKKLSYILGKLKFKLPTNPKISYILPTVIKTIKASKSVPLSEIENLPVMTDPRINAIMKLLATGFSSLPINPKFFGMIMCNIFYLTVKYGRSEFAPLACQGFAYLLILRFQRYWKANDYAEAGFSLAKRYGYKTALPRAIVAFNANISYTKNAYRDSLPMLLEGHKIALEMGNFEFAVLSLVVHDHILFSIGAPIESVLEKMIKLKKYSEQLKQEYEVQYVFPQMQMIDNLLSDNFENIDILEGHFFSEKQTIPLFYKRNDHFGMGFTYCFKLQLAYLFGDLDRGFAYSNIGRPYFKFLTPHIVYSVFIFYETLILIRRQPSLSLFKRLHFRRRINKNIKRIKKLAASAPMNFQSRYFLLKAELARLDNKYEEVIVNYEKAISAAHENDATNEEALAKESLGTFYLQKNNEAIAKIYLLQAYYAYTVWGANAKLAQMRTLYPWLSKNVSKHNLDLEFLSNLTTTTTFNMSQLDYHSLMKASVAISGEIYLPQLIQRLLEILTENVAAERAVLLLKKNNLFFIEGDLDVQQGIKSLMQSTASNEGGLLPLSVIQYVINSHKNVLLDNAKDATQFISDEYFIENDIKSVICAPILHKGELLGLLYLENNTSTHVFTPNRLEFINILSSQIAVSIENARLYYSFERFVPTKFLELLGRKNPTEVALGDSVQKELTVLFMDIRNFTTLAERYNVEDLFKILNKFLAHVTPIMEKYSGFIDKFIGDAILALFADKPDDALNAAVEMQKALITFNTENQLNWRIGIGINTGICMLGTLGYISRMDGSVISDAVNIASRIEGLAKFYGAEILLQDETVSALKDKTQFNIRYVDKVILKGRTRQNIIWECIDAWPTERQALYFENFDIYSQAMKAYQYGDFTQALQLFKKYLENVAEDSVVKLYIVRCKHYIEKGIPEDWEGSTIFKHK